MAGPLDGIIVVTLEAAVSAPLCSRHLGDLGARVIKVENRVGGDFARAYDTDVRGLASHFVWLNRNKESVAVDLKRPAGREILDRLVARADVVVQNLAPGAAGRLGVAAADVVARHPQVIAVDISGYGDGGPLAQRRAYDLLVQAEAGSLAITGRPGEPAKPGIPIADVGAGMYALTAILAALYARTSSGQGTAISVGMFDVVAEWMGFALNATRYGAGAPVPNGASSPMVAPYGAYPTADGHTVVLGTTNDGEWLRLAAMIERPDLAADPAYRTNAGRVTRRPDLDEAVGAWTGGRTLAEVQRAADAHTIGHARLNEVADVVDHPQLAARGRWVDIDSPAGPVTGLLPPPVMSGWTPRTDRIPALGADTDAVLGWLGYTAHDRDELRRDATI